LNIPPNLDLSELECWGEAAAEQTLATAGNVERFRHVPLVRKGHGLVPAEKKSEKTQAVTEQQNWWRRGESNSLYNYLNA
jgi:hypothetical protein